MRRILASFCLCFLFVLPCRAQDKAKSNTLTPKEIAEGWLLLFDGEGSFGWKARVEQQYLRKFGDTLDMGATMIEVQHTTEFPAFECQFEYITSTYADFGVRDTSGNSRKFTKLDRNKKGWTSVTVRLADGQVTFETLKGKTTEPWKGPAMIWFSPNSNFKIRNIKLRPLNTKSLFNGKDLTGWKEFPGKKSKFAVIDSAINVKDGPGDLQTVDKFKDFVLQLECISNGKHLNSGIFFRCRDNEYQNGYEAQIRNEFKPEAMQKYQIEEYDPKTNKLIGKKELMSTAVDFGTGAIYRRQPARKQMSKDGEWFTMTVVAHGNHIATWVNGVQVTDWHDNRPKSDNARTGCRLEGGHISIQGHDPTTDLSFRNLRIVEMK